MTKASRGFTLIEVLVGMLVLGLAAAGTAVTMRSVANYVGENATYVDAIAAAQGAMEDLRARRYEEITSGSATSGGFSISWNVQPDTPEAGMKAVAVTASWTWKGEPRSYVLKTVYSKLTRS